jgi:hypothetical protein
VGVVADKPCPSVSVSHHMNPQQTEQCLARPQGEVFLGSLIGGRFRPIPGRPIPTLPNAL